MRQFFKFLFASMLGFVLGSILLVFILAGMISAAVNSFDDEKVTEVKSNSMLFLDFEKPIVDRASKNPFENINFNTFESEPSAGLNTILENLRKAKEDKNIKGIYMELSTINTGIATVEEIRNALLEGVVVGGGCALKHIAKTLKSDDIGYNVLLKSVCEPFYQILTNASIEYLDIFGDEKTEIKKMKLGQIYNTNTKKIEYSKDVFDTVKGLRCAVQNSVSVSNIVLSIDGALC